MNEAMNIYETFDNLRYHLENKVVELRKWRTTSISMTWERTKDHKVLSRKQINGLLWNK